ncbi:hypothetical protein ACIBL5_06500 [Streptomyces sp. NPDC050516]|uniref:hypothetical protein n=1 Tax=Streptomyces sp. NPDC050516 TaxID=3365621 RepID=UPI00378FF7B4
MTLGDQLTQQALTCGRRVTLAAAPPGIVRLAITLSDGSVQHFERRTIDGEDGWRATDFEAPGAGCYFDEPVTAEWGRGLNALTC